MQKSKHITDEELLRRIKQDDSMALKVLFQRYYSTLCRFAFRFVNITHLAEEVVSDVFLNVWLRKKNIEIRTNLRTYLFTAVRNQSLNYLKHNTFSFEDIETVDEKNVISELHPHAHMIYEELKDNVDALLKQLPEKRQIIFKMNRIDGLSYKEIAEILSISVNTVQNQMVAAVKFISGHHPRRK